MTPSTPATIAVHLQIPAEARYLRLARLTASSLAADLDFGTDELDDLKVAVDELCAVLLHEADGPLDLSFETNGRRIVVQGSCATASDTPPELHPFASELLSIVADSFSLELEAGRCRFELERSGRPDT
jgi:serine/threonine-protein kinase RsbW